MLEVHFLVGAGVLALVVVFLVLSGVEEGYEDEQGFKFGKPPEGTDPQRGTVVPKMGCDANLPRWSEPRKVSEIVDRDEVVAPSKHNSAAELEKFLKEARTGRRAGTLINRDQFRSEEFMKWLILGVVALVLLLGVAITMVGLRNEFSEAPSVWEENSRR